MAGPDDNILQDAEHSYGTAINPVASRPVKKKDPGWWSSLFGDTGIVVNTLRNFQHGNLQPMLFCCLFPWALFTTIFGLLSFSFHYFHDGLCWWVFVWCLLLTLTTLGATMIEFKKYQRGRRKFPTWYVFLSATMVLACVLGLIFGCCNFASNTNPYLTILNMRTYAGIDPSKTQGGQLLDAGQISFTNNSVLDLGKSQGFKNGQTYCVAPIVVGDMTRKLASYDFWAVGIDCCTSSQPSFHCGQYLNGRARSGIRATHRTELFPHRNFFDMEWYNKISSEDEAMFTMAVNQAAARHNLQVLKPLFFQWVEDPIAAVSKFNDRAVKAYALGVMLFFAFQFFSAVMIYLFVHKQ